MRGVISVSVKSYVYDTVHRMSRRTHCEYQYKYQVLRTILYGICKSEQSEQALQLHRNPQPALPLPVSLGRIEASEGL